MVTNQRTSTSTKTESIFVIEGEKFLSRFMRQRKRNRTIDRTTANQGSPTIIPRKCSRRRALKPNKSSKIHQYIEKRRKTLDRRTSRRTSVDCYPGETSRRKGAEREELNFLRPNRHVSDLINLNCTFGRGFVYLMHLFQLVFSIKKMF